MALGVSPARGPQMQNMLAYLILLVRGAWNMVTWQNLLILYLLANLKNLPLAWELRLVYRGWRAWKSKAEVTKILNASVPKPDKDKHHHIDAAMSHPLFRSLTISSHTPLLEIDHNLHKSNSTYFSDLDESRTALMTHLLSSTRFSGKELEQEGYKGPLSVILGSVHTSFLHEIKPYESYSVRSRVMGWGRKWIVIGSYFVRSTKSKRELERNKGRKEFLLACSLSKYVVKKGRFTVAPERCFRGAGWLPENPAEGSSETVSQAQETTESSTPDSDVKAAEVVKDGVQEIATNVTERLEQHRQPRNKIDEECAQAAAAWPWAAIEKERLRGLETAEKWLSLDIDLKEGYEKGFSV